MEATFTTVIRAVVKQPDGANLIQASPNQVTGASYALKPKEIADAGVDWFFTMAGSGNKISHKKRKGRKRQAGDAAKTEKD
jgi:hypothetical protein